MADRYEVPILANLAGLETGVGDQSVTGEQIRSWNATKDAVQAHRDTLMKAKRELEELWPPSSSEAAQAFSAFVTNFVDSMDKTVAAASNTATALNDIDTAIVNAKTKIVEIKKKWDEIAKKEKSHEDDNIAEQAWNWAFGDDVPDNWRKDLTDQAYREAVNPLNAAAAAAAAKMEVPPVYVATMGPVDDPGPSAGDQSGTGLSGTGTGRNTRTTTTDKPRDDHGIPELQDRVTVTDDGQIIGSRDPGPGTPPTGPVLSGGTAPPPPAPPVTPTPTDLAPGKVIGPGGPGPGGFPPVSGPVVSPGLGGGPGPSGLGKGPTTGRSPMTSRLGGGGEGPTGRGGLGGTPLGGGGGPRGGASGRVIGGAPGGRAGGIGAPGAQGSAAGRAGGRVIGGAGVRGGAPGATGARGGTMPGGAAGRRGRRSGEEGRQFDPDNPWQVDQGGPEVIAPGAESDHHDPGPGVIGVDR